MGFTPWGPAAPLGLVAATPYPGGFALQNATPAILTWTAPADGRPHRVMVLGEVFATSGGTGGQCTLSYTTPAGGAGSQILVAGNAGAGSHPLNNPAGLAIAPGSTVTIAQSSALTAGAVAGFFEVWAS